jgi:DNA-directed RNA polymerase subunit beta'
MEIQVKAGDLVQEKSIIARADNNKSHLKSEFSGEVIEVDGNEITIRSKDLLSKTYKIPLGRIVLVKNGATVKKGQALTTGHLNLKELMALTDVYSAQKYIVSEIQSIYASQGQTINDKHIEIIARQMLSKVRIMDAGDSQYLPGEIADILDVEETNRELVVEGKKKATFERLLLGLTRISLYTDSWLSAASFQETIRVLVDAATTNKVDNLEGLKENVIIGKLIPAGETFRKKFAKANPEISEDLIYTTKNEEYSPENEMPVI